MDNYEKLIKLIINARQEAEKHKIIRGNDQVIIRVGSMPVSKFLTEEMDIIAHEEGVRIVVNKENQVFATATMSYIQITTE